MDELIQRVRSLEEKIDRLERSIQIIKKVFIWMLVASVVAFVLPLIGLVFVIPSFISSYTSVLQF